MTSLAIQVSGVIVVSLHLQLFFSAIKQTMFRCVWEQCDAADSGLFFLGQNKTGSESSTFRSGVFVNIGPVRAHFREKKHTMCESVLSQTNEGTENKAFGPVKGSGNFAFWSKRESKRKGRVERNFEEMFTLSPRGTTQKVAPLAEPFNYASFSARRGRAAAFSLHFLSLQQSLPS